MDDPKNRGKQHLKNKAKYKNKSQTTKTKIISTISPPLMSNWDRYRDGLPSTSTSMHGKDFSVLAEAPISKGSHFQFKSDAHDRFSVDNNPVNTNVLFNLDLNLLGLSLASIPFNERCAIPENYFTVTQLDVMRKTARDSARLYQQSMQNNKLKISAEVEGRDVFPSRKNITSGGHFNITNESLSTLKQLDICLANSHADEYDSDYRDKFITEGISSNSKDKLYPSINKLNELEEELSKMELMKNISKNSPANIDVNKYKDESSPIQTSKFPKSSCDVVDHSFKHTRDIPTTSGSSLLETESLQQWLDDVLGD